MLTRYILIYYDLGGPAPPTHRPTLCRRAVRANSLPTHHAPPGANLLPTCKDLLPYKTHPSPTLTLVNVLPSLPRSPIASPVGLIRFRFAFICFPDRRRQQVLPSAQAIPRRLLRTSPFLPDYALHYVTVLPWVTDIQPLTGLLKVRLRRDIFIKIDQIVFSCLFSMNIVL